MGSSQLTMDEALRLGNEFHRAGQFEDAERVYRAILAAQPHHPEANHDLGVLAVQAGKAALGLPFLKAALEARPGVGAYWLDLLEALLAAGQCDGARSVLDQGRRQGLAGPPVDDLAARLEKALERQSRLRALEDLFRAGSYAAMEAKAKEFLERFPESGKGWHLLGLSLVARGDGAAALEPLLRAVATLPNDVDLWDHLGSAYLHQGQPEQAANAFRRALALRPDYPSAHNNLGNALRELGQPQEAMASYRQALRCQPNHAMAHTNLGIVLQSQGQVQAALECHARALALAPANVEAHVNYANAQKELGHIEAAVAAYGRALALDPERLEARTNLLLLEAFSNRLTPQAFLAEARGLDRVLTGQADREGGAASLPRRARQGRRLRVGYVSGDLCGKHPVPFFLGPLLAAHDRRRVEVFLYPTQRARDDTTERLQHLGDHWSPLTGLTDRQAAKRVRADGIDVLVDLSGHTRYNRLGIFARRAAPVQAHYLGYCATTGLSAMDYWIGDSVLFPEGETPPYSETPWRLPRPYLCYDGREDLPGSAWTPRGNGEIWFGSFNHLSKIQDATLDLWSRILSALPEGKLLLKSGQLDHAANRERMLAAFEGRGIARDRLVLMGQTANWPAHMAAYDLVDVALDPVDAVSGVTTTCDALWMGVPVVTMAGDRLATRMAASLVSGLGHGDWVAATPEAYAGLAVALARDVAGRTGLRSGQRERMRASPLTDARDLARCLEEAYEAMARP
ncbi:Tetratricopeptide TPR_1 repeat-containing protein [Solidesulfovibrio carbinoliphilus subsp. oakridgensis]|uniref:protein O-GlcNAc transferase n=1 Tax=Solidesulfovibrio carbinoliphilus subsp. oakridgensis TaxID=694327 RepID=G7Q637_9BACT|nr:tetratricopeptide repeat protein [Solidesulfovibrio carbinoliphilus]EHJ47053.1 Tetratricopeptide TPR_1 repeat-containing protein [Solidesulfovibrio carbinoliphilus subsp. oakridgensis]